MQYTKLGTTGLRVSRLCLGSMTWGEQNTEAEGHAQLDRALAAGINFIDTAEMYPIPPRAGSQGKTESILGSWLKDRGVRDQVIVATKVAGPGRQMAHLRGGPVLDASHIDRAVADSLRRLQTDYIDLYQVHWPQRTTNYFGRLGYVHRPQEDGVPIEESLQALARHVAAGRVRAIGISNETPWGLARYLRLSDEAGLPRVASIQNPYNLLNRIFEIGLSEMSLRENVGLLAYSPLAFGVLTGKYAGGKRPSGSRLERFPNYGRYTNQYAIAATESYLELALAHGLSPASLALAFVSAQPFTASAIIGATTLEQLEENLASVSVAWTPELAQAVDAIHVAHPNPAP
ncbi:MAG: NADP(H)-dependent aldo-keto reductase [Gammaproteobacteria bacterium]|nr:NADP(H)-dependent aldo-keto reductase [Gammaproteobacteria bacterium]